jgi:hypothetical protein
MAGDSLTYNTATRKFMPDSTVIVTLHAPSGVRLVYCYLMRTGAPDAMIYFDTASAGTEKDFTFHIPYAVFRDADMSGVTGVKVMAKLLDNSSFEGIVPITPFTPPLPVLRNFPDTLMPDLAGGKTTVAGEVSSESGLSKIVLEDDYKGDFSPVDSVTGLQGVKDYSLSYNYAYRQYATHLKVIATDIYGLTTSFVITMPVLPYDVWKDVTMMAQGTSSAASPNCFFMESGTLTGTCDISGHEPEINFLTYCNTSPAMYFYSPTNTANVAKNFKCSGTAWAPDVTTMKATRFRVLVPGSAATDAIYAAYNANAITTLDDAFFDGISDPSASSSKFIADESQEGSSVFNLTSAYLIWVRIPVDGGGYKNGLIRVKAVDVNSDSGSQGLSTITFDLMLQH